MKDEQATDRPRGLTQTGRDMGKNDDIRGRDREDLEEGEEGPEDEEGDAVLKNIRLEDELYGEQLELHPEYRRFIEECGLDETYFDETGQEVNPHLHLTTHVVLEKQIRFDNPPFVRKTIEQLEARGEDPHEARHAVMAVLVELMWEIMTKKRPFDEKRYKKRLKRLE